MLIGLVFAQMVAESASLALGGLRMGESRHGAAFGSFRMGQSDHWGAFGIFRMAQSDRWEAFGVSRTVQSDDWETVQFRRRGQSGGWGGFGDFRSLQSRGAAVRRVHHETRIAADKSDDLPPQLVLGRMRIHGTGSSAAGLARAEDGAKDDETVRTRQSGK